MWQMYHSSLIVIWIMAHIRGRFGRRSRLVKVDFAFLIRLSRLVILKSRPRIFTTFHLWKCRYHVYWNLSYPLSILKVIFLKSNPLVPLQFKETLISFNNKQELRHWKGVTIKHCVMGNLDQTFCLKLLLTKRSFDLFFSHLCDIKS